MFYAAKTLVDRYVGIMYDRIGGKDDTNMQSLLGRACGYGKSDRTIIYTSRSTLENYRSLWKDICVGDDRLIANVPLSVKAIDGKMPSVNAISDSSNTCRLVVQRLTAMPIKSASIVSTENAYSTAKETKDTKMTVPLVIKKVSDGFIDEINRFRGKYAANKKQELVRKLVMKSYPGHSFNEYLVSYKSLGVEIPKSSGSIKRKILAPITAAEEGRNYIIDVHEEDRNNNVWLAKVDPKDKRVVILVWKGASSTEDNQEDEFPEATL
jgi:hypothetical protein